MLVTILGLVVILVMVALIGAGSPRALAIGAIPSTVALLACLACYRWIDRWEPEPVGMLVMTLVWGGSVAVVLATVVEALAGTSDLVTAVLVAPPVEEFAKASVFLVLLTGVRKLELTSLTDHLVYAGVCALGFAFVENLGYFASAEGAGDVVVMTLVRTGFGVFGHPLFTSATAVGLWSWRHRGGFWRVVVGYLVACLLHGLWNGGPDALTLALGDSDLSGLVSMALVYLVLFVPVFVVAVRMVLRSRRREIDAASRQLPLMVAAGLVTPAEADMVVLPQLRHRGTTSRSQRAARDRMVTAVMEAAAAQERISSGQGGPELVRRRNELSAWLRARPDKVVART